MSDFVLDCSVAMAWCFDDLSDPSSEAALEALGAGQTALAPAHWPLETAGALLAAERRGRLKQADSARFLDLVRGLPIEVESAPLIPGLTAVLGLAKEHDLGVHDASYIELAMRKGVPLVTLDAKLRGVAAGVGVQILGA